jgi:hypothetical protein
VFVIKNGEPIEVKKGTEFEVYSIGIRDKDTGEEIGSFTYNGRLFYSIEHCCQDDINYLKSRGTIMRGEPFVRKYTIMWIK